MSIQYTEADLGLVNNQPAIVNIRAYGSDDDYVETLFSNGVTFNFTSEPFT